MASQHLTMTKKPKTTPPLGPLLSLPAEIRVFIWEYLCTAPHSIHTYQSNLSWEYLCTCTPFPIDITTPRHRNCSPIRFSTTPYEPVQRILGLARTCRTIYFEIMPLFYARNVFVLPPALAEMGRAMHFPVPKLHPRAAHITRFAMVVSVFEAREVIWQTVALKAHELREQFPALREFRVDIMAKETCMGPLPGRNWVSREWVALDLGHWAYWHVLLVRRENEDQGARIVRFKEWLVEMEGLMKKDAAIRNMKVVLEQCCNLLDLEGFQKALVEYMDECDERGRQRISPSKVSAQLI